MQSLFIVSLLHLFLLLLLSQLPLVSEGNDEASVASLDGLSEGFTTSVSGNRSSSNFPLLIGIDLLNVPSLSATESTVSTSEIDLKFLSSAPNYKVNSLQQSPLTTYNLYHQTFTQQPSPYPYKQKTTSYGDQGSVFLCYKQFYKNIFCTSQVIFFHLNTVTCYCSFCLKVFENITS